jgi:hypothetical protein
VRSVEKGVTNGGTIVHGKSDAKNNEQERKEQLFTDAGENQSNK